MMMRFVTLVSKLVITLLMWLIAIGIYTDWLETATTDVADKLTGVSSTTVAMPYEMVVAMFVVVLVGTLLMWGLPELVKLYSIHKGVPLEAGGGKAKRSERDRIALLLELMDDDEREAFKQAMQERLLDNPFHEDEDRGTTLESLFNDDAYTHER